MDLAHGHLFCGNLFPPPFSGGQIGRWFVQRRFVKTALESDSGERDRHSGTRRFLIGIRPEHRSPSARNPDRHQPGIRTEPPLLLQLLAPGALGRTVREAYLFNAQLLLGGFAFGRIESCVAGHQARRAAQLPLMGFDRWRQKRRISRPLGVNFITRVQISCLTTFPILRTLGIARF